ncbi:MMPL domain protein [metagenome]|uniref:MMPL domain protein n=1 Tax=metagenome TaxID=256318 RepID=A0A2P2C7F0_9ZZZZ
MPATPPTEREDGLDHASGTSITQLLARVAALHPWRVVTVWGLILAASVVAIGTLLGSAFTSDASLTTRTDSAEAQQVMAQHFSQGDRIDEAVIIHSAELTATSSEFRAFVADLRSSIQDTGATQRVRDPYAAEQPAISEDGHAVVVTLVLGHDAETGIVNVLDEVVAADAAKNFDVDITGTNTLDHDFTELSESDLTNGELKFGLPAAMIVLLLVFGALVAAFIPMSIAIGSIIVTVAISSVLGQFTSLSFFIVNMITAMGLALGIDYSLFVLSRYREERQNGRAKIDAILATGGTSSKAVLFSGSSFVVALLGLLLVPDTILRSLALGAIVVGLVTMAAAITLLPALLSLLGDHVNALRLPFVGRDHPAESPFWTRAVRAVVRRPAIALTLGVLILLAAAYPVLGLRTGTSGVESLPDSTFAKSGALALERSFPGTSTTEPAQVVITGDISSAAVTTAIARFEESVTDDRDFGPSQQQVSEDGTVAVISIPLVGDADHAQARRGLDRLRSELIPAAFDATSTSVLVGGATAENVDYSDVINRWLPIVLAFVLVLSFLLLTLVFRSLVLSLTAVVLNLLSVGAAYGLLVLVFQHGVGADLLGLQQVERVEAWVPVFLFSVLFALSMDYHVFLLSRIRERYAQTGDTEEAVVHGIAATGRIITGAALIIVVVFTGFAAGQLVMFQQMGFGVGVALLVDATLIRMVVVPAVMTLLGRWNWYLPTWLNWMPELHVEGDPALHQPATADSQSEPVRV